MTDETVPSILTDEEATQLDSTLKGLGVTGSLRPGRRAEIAAEVEGIVREACARSMDRLSGADPMTGAVWGICRLGAKPKRPS